MFLVWLKFIACVLIVLFAGRNVARYGDIIAEKTGLGGIWIGVLLVAIATSLPELFTGISAAALLKTPDIAIGDLFGANTFNLLNLAILAIVYKKGSLFGSASPRNTLSAGLSVIMVALPAVMIFMGSSIAELSIGWIGVYTPVLFILYLVIMRVIFNYERNARNTAQPAETLSSGALQITLKRAYIYYSLAAAVIIGAGVWLSFIGNEIAEATGWEQSFVGSLFIAFATTLPEISVSFAALRLGAIDICVANMIGSNIFNMTIIGIIDLFYLEGPVLAVVSGNHIITAFTVIFMTGVLIAALYSKYERRVPVVASWYSLVLIFLFLAGTYANYAF